MPKKRRKPRNRPRTAPQGGTRTAERPKPDGAGRAKAPDATAPERKPAVREGRPPQRPRSEKKDLARHQRELVRKQIARQRRTRQAIRVAAIAAVVAVGVYFFTRPDATRPAGPLPGELATQVPWPVNSEQAAERADLIGLPAEGTTQHTHTNLQVFVNGVIQPIPANIGISGSIASLHTHEQDASLIHVESQTVRDFTLGEFFDVWGVRLTPSCVGAYCNDDEARLRVFVNGVEITGSPRDMVLEDLDVIVVTYGSEDQLPDPIPSTHDFSAIP